jgi:pimeloyl-ACP methyl ester carboxylesterase
VEFEAMVKSFEQALIAGDRNAAAIIIDFYNHRGFFEKMPEQVRVFCEATASTNLRDWHSAATFMPSFEEFAALDLPVQLVRGSDTPKPIVDVTKELATNIPNAEQVIVEGADHFLISTHPGACTKILQAHLDASTHQDQLRICCSKSKHVPNH